MWEMRLTHNFKVSRYLLISCSHSLPPKSGFLLLLFLQPWCSQCLPFSAVTPRCFLPYCSEAVACSSAGVYLIQNSGYQSLTCTWISWWFYWSEDSGGAQESVFLTSPPPWLSAAAQRTTTGWGYSSIFCFLLGCLDSACKLFTSHPVSHPHSSVVLRSLMSGEYLNPLAHLCIWGSEGGKVPGFNTHRFT